MRYIICVILLLSFRNLASSQSPNDAVIVSLKHAKTLTTDEARRTRYLSLYNLNEVQIGELQKALSFHVNSLSREGDVTKPKLIAPNLVRVILDDYTWKRETWERLADVDPHFHQAKLIDEDIYEDKEFGWWVTKDGRMLNEKTPGSTWKLDHIEKRKVGTKKIRKNALSASWLDTNAISELIVLTNSQVPIVRADWFIVQTAIARKDQVSYYDFLELGDKEKDFLDLIGADIKLSKAKKKEIAAILDISGVAINNRRIVVLQSVTGPYFLTQDFNTSTGQQNVARFLDGDTEPPNGDASEQYGVLSNGLFCYWLQNGNGIRQDIVPQGIALDNHTKNKDKNIHGGIKSCVSCHIEGIRPIDDYARRVFEGEIPLQSPNYQKYIRLKQLYLSDLEGRVRRTNQDYTEVLLRVNGLTPQKNAKLYEQTWDDYVEIPVTLEQAAREIGCTPEKLLNSMNRYRIDEQAKVGFYDPVVGRLLKNPPIPIRREHFDEVFGLLQTIIRIYP